MNFEGEDIVIGYKYFLGLHIVICHYNPHITILHLSFGDRFVAARETEDGPLIESVEASGRYYLDSPELFGGEKKEGGVQGYVDIMFGEPNQPQNAYLQEKLGAEIPAFRGVLSAVFNQCYLTSMTPYPKAMSVTLQAGISSGLATSAIMPDGSVNTISAIVALLTNTSWGLGYPASSINKQNFQYAADTIDDEEMGVSFALVDQEPIRDTIQMLLNHANGMLYTDPKTGKFCIKLLRADWNPDFVPVLNETNIIKLDSFERPGYAEMVNEIVVKYRPQGTDKDDSVTVQNLGLIQAQGGVVPETVSYPAFDTARKASRMGQTLLRQKSTPLARLKATVNLDAKDFTIGDVFKFQWAAYNIDAVYFRILKINYGDPLNQSISIDAVEDVFGISSIEDDYINPQESGWIDEAVNPLPNPYTVVWEAPYIDLVNKLSQSQLSGLDATSGFIEAISGVPAQYSTDYEFWTAEGVSGAFKRATQSTYCPHAKLEFAIGGLQSTFTITDFKGSLIPLDLHRYAMIGDEIVRVDSLDLETMTVTVGRGCMDTVPASHTGDARIYFVDIYKALDITEYSAGQLIKGKVRPNVGGEQLALNAAPEHQVLMKSRAVAPYPPAQVKINGGTIYTGSNLSISAAAQITISWVHRDRTIISELLDHTAASVGPESGTTYTLKFYVGAVLKHTASGLTGTSYTWASESADSGLPDGEYNSAVRVTLESVRDGINSYQKYDFTVTR